VLGQATRDAAIWHAQQDLDLSISVNISPRQLHDPELVATAAGAIADAGLPPDALTIEITENLLLKDTELAQSRLGALRELGVKVAVDDFGTGYSSLAYLDRYPVDILKIDRSFVAPLGESKKSAALVRAIIELAAALEMDTVAEGVETDVQRRTLQSLGCSRAQGFFFARPVPAHELAAVLRRRTLGG
jgi:EAL domain-containing protein (putative c-di-GMP-specific phosphodiesterase class I)